MAGDWIPMRVDLADDPAVILMAGRLGMDEFSVVGRLHHLWAWANRQLESGNAPGVTVLWLDRYVGVSGFANALTEAGWLVVQSDGVHFPNFERWNSKSAKKRLLTAQRVRIHRNANCNAGSVTKALPEKRREENKENPPTPQKGGDTVPIPDPLNVPEFRQAWADWLADRRARNKKVTQRSAELSFGKLIPLGPVLAVECIRNSIANSWTGLFPERVSGPSLNGNHSTDKLSKREAEIEAALARGAS